MRHLVLFILALTLSFQTVAAQDDLTDITVFMPFIPNIQFAPVYVAMENGYFAEAGLNVSLEYGFEPDGLELIASGQMDYGFVGGEQVILARANQRPIVFVYEWYQRNPIAIVIPTQTEDAVVFSPDNLAGMKIGVPGRFGATYTSFIGMLSATNLTEDDIQLEEIGFNAPDVVCVGDAVEAAVVYINNEPLQIRNRSLAENCGDVTDIQVIAIADYVDLVSNGIVASETKITENPEQVQAFVNAFERGLMDTINNPIAAYALSVPLIEGLPYENEQVFADLAASTVTFLDTNPTPQEIADRRDFLIAQTRTVLNADELLQIEVLLETIKLWEAETPGVTDMASWEITQDSLLDIAFLESEIDLDAAFTNDFVPETTD